MPPPKRQRPLRILFPYTGDSVGGSHISSLTLARGLDRERFEPVVALHGEGVLTDYLAKLGIEWIAAPSVTPPRLRALWRQWPKRRACRTALVPWLDAQRIDIVHSQDMRMHLAWASTAAHRPHIWHQRTPLDSPHAAAHAARSARFIAVSDFVRQSLAPNLRPRAEVIYNPFETPAPQDHAQARQRILNEMGLDSADAVVGFVSNLSPRKRPELFVEIAARLQERLPHRRLVFPMFGEKRPPHDAEVEARIAALGMAPHVQLMGTRYPFGPWLAGFDLLVGPARKEALGRTIVEATMAGVPLVATREGGNLEIVEHEVTGLLAQPDDVEAFAAMAARLLEEPGLAASLTERAKAHSHETFSLAAHLEKMSALYETLRPAG